MSETKTKTEIDPGPPELVGITDLPLLLIATHAADSPGLRVQRTTMAVVLNGRDIASGGVVDASGQPPTSSGYTMSVGVLVPVVIFGTIIPAIALGFLFLYISRRRRAAREARGEDNIEHSASDVSVAEDASSGLTCNPASPKKLQKRESMDRMVEASPCDKPPHPMVPRIFTRRNRFDPLRKSSESFPGEKRHKRKVSWIDEDALHGPTIKPKMVRNSWPMKDVSPTLPDLSRAAFMQRQHMGPRQQPLTAETIPVKRPQSQPMYVSPRKLPQPPKAAVIVNGKPLPRQPVGNVYCTNDPQRLRSSVNITPTRRSFRHASTDSTLSEILKSTEKRLQEGGTSGVAERNRASITTDIGSRRSKAGSDVSSLGKSPVRYHPYTVPQPPSPTKSRSSTPSHKRSSSSASAASEAESEIVEAGTLVIPDTLVGLTSPSRGAPATEEKGRPRSVSQTSTLSSSLSTVYSVEEAQDGNATVLSTPATSSVPDVSRMPKLRHGATEIDPFMFSSRPGSPSRPTTSHSQGSSHINSYTGAPDPEKQPRPSRLTMGQPPACTLPGLPGRISISSVLQGSPALVCDENISPGSSPRSRTADIYAHSPARSDSQLGLENPVKESPASARKTCIYNPRNSFFGAGPFFVVTSPSEASTGPSPRTQSDPTTIERLTQSSPIRSVAVSPTPELRSRRGSVSLVRQSIETDGHVPNHANLAYVAGNETGSPPRRRGSRRSSTFRVTSTSSSVYSQDIKDELASIGSESNRSSFIWNQGPESQSFRRGSVRQSMSNKNMNRASVATTIAELRRMNSTLSTYSHASSQAGDGGSPTLPFLRGGGFSPAHTGNRGSKNYLAMGSPPKRASVVSVASVGGSPSRSTSLSRKRHSKREVDAGILLKRLGLLDVAEDAEEQGENGAAPVGEATQAQLRMKLPKLDVAGPNGGKRRSTGLREGSGGNITSPTKYGKVLDDDREKWNTKKRGSEESLGLYDPDGFLMSTPVKANGSPRRNSGLRM